MTMLCTVVSLVLAALPIPQPGTTPANAVDYQVIHDLTLRKAQAEWPGCRLGPVIPYVDETGATVGYMFHFRTDGAQFPSQEQVTANILADRDRMTVNTDLTKWTSRYSFVLASARYDLAPFIHYGYGSSEFYAIGEEALARARQLLGNDATLTRIYFIECRAFLEFGNPAGEHVVLSDHFEQTWQSREAFRQYVVQGRAGEQAQDWYNAAQVARIHRQEWQEALTRDFTDITEYFVPNADRAPFYNWGYGCSPTSGAMVLGYIDRTQNYGRLVDHYWQRYDMVIGGMDYQTPNTQLECAKAMNTDTTTGSTYMSNIPGGLQNAANGNGNGYSFTVTSATGSSGNDWAWSTITSEINAGYAMVWSVTWQSHSLACYGYRSPEQDVFVHNTWWAPADWWAHSGSGLSQVASPHPAGADAHKAELIFPRGDTNYNATGKGEVVQVGDTAMVTWNNFGNPGTRVDIELSLNGGRAWQSLASVPDSGLYKWYVSPLLSAQESVRLRLKQYNGSTLTSGDGSFSNFILIREPLPPAFLAPNNGQQIFTPPVVLVVDSLYSGDSLDYRLIYAGDTLLRLKTTEPTWQVPDTVLVYGRSYKWTCRAHNQYGWGRFGTPWSFWVKFNAGVGERNPQAIQPGLEVASINLLASDVAFEVARPAAGSKLVICNALGSVIRELPADRARVSWDVRDQSGAKQSAGLYFVQLLSGSTRATAKFVLVD